MSCAAVAGGCVPQAGSIVVFDLEFTAWPGSMARGWTGPGEYREVVQIGAVRAQFGSDLEVLDRFDQLVQPRVNPVLSEYLTELTGITQAAVDHTGVDFPNALAAFAGFCGDGVPIASNGTDLGVLQENCRLCRCALPLAVERFVNVRPLLSRAAGWRTISSCDLPKAFPDVPQLPPHNALADALMIVHALAHLMRRQPGVRINDLIGCDMGLKAAAAI